MLGALILGLVAGSVARLLMPGDVFRHMSGPKSWLVSIVIGLIGAFVGWLIFAKWLGIGDDEIFDLTGIVGAIVGTLIVLPIAGWVLRRSAAKKVGLSASFHRRAASSDFGRRLRGRSGRHRYA